MSDYVGDGLGWSCGRLVPPVALMSSRDTATTTWRSPGDARILPGPSARASRSATVTARSFAGISRRRGLPMGTAWGTMDPLAPPAPAPLVAPLESVDRPGDSPLVTVHLKNHSCAASGSEAFFNLSQHGGRRGTAISRSSSCVSAISRNSYRLHSLTPPTPPTIPTTHTSLGRRTSNALNSRRVGRSYSVAPADWSSSAMTGARVVGRRAQRLQLPALPVQQQPPTPREHKLSHPQNQQYYQQNILIQQQPEKQLASCGGLDESNQNLEGDNAMSLPPSLPPARPRPPTPPPLPLKWHRTAAPSTSGCRCQPCSVGVLVARAYKAVLKAASTCMFRKYMGEFDLMTANGK
ncbi:uncharacterized protein LOC122249345 [Penaeus japonicus]|uniref:uncharacterized protein LOC122249345 n=1 Tax=Penaeus japonicus TaxID=27405 RepID=UPI001C7104DE|nr:uncharacterized protein LOC122249345 [Penaeus japonicus]